MTTTQNEKKLIAGISVRTSNDGPAMQDIPALWNRFMSEGIAGSIPDKASNDIYAIYTRYESDQNGPYTMIIGCPVSTIENLPTDMDHIELHAGNYHHMPVKGNLEKGKMIYEAWMEIWKMGLNRNYTTDYEVYGSKSMDMKNAEVDIYVSVD